jgi:hypothetical protein
LSRTAFPTAPLAGTCGGTTGSSCPSRPSRTGSRLGGEKAEEFVRGEFYLDEALAEFSGYVAADEIYDGPFSILFIVDNRKFRRLAYEVLDHNPTKEDVEAFFERFKEALDARGLRLLGVTTDGSPLYPEPIENVFGDVPHQVCEFHVLKEINKAVLRAVAKVRKELAREVPKLPRGRPSKETKAGARKAKRLREKIGELFVSRHLLVKRDLTQSERKTLERITRGHTELKRLREIVDEVYRLFDRRCRTETALVKLARLRRKAWRFKSVRQALKKLWSPNLEKALTFLDDKLLPATSNAVERTNRRHRKMQNSVYRVRTKEHVSARIALDCLREARASARATASAALHVARTSARARAAPTPARRKRRAA